MSMSFLSMVEAELPPGFRFHPRDDELICDYLVPKVSGKVGFSGHRPPMVDVDLNRVEPWDLPAVATVGGKEEWYFFSLRDRKYATGQRTNRATVSGYWKATGKDRVVTRRRALVGMRKTLVFYQGRAPKGRKTEWVMHEYRLEGAHEQASRFTSKEDWVLCRVISKKKSGGGGTCRPRNLTTIGHDTSTAISSPPLPPLMDTTLAQLQATMNTTTTSAAAFEQVPCFSSFNNNIASNNNSATVVHPCYLPMVTGSNGLNYLDHGLPNFGSYLDPTLNCDKKMLKAVLSQLSSMGSEVMPSLPPDMLLL